MGGKVKGERGGSAAPWMGPERTTEKTAPQGLQEEKRRGQTGGKGTVPMGRWGGGGGEEENQGGFPQK